MNKINENSIFNSMREDLWFCNLNFSKRNYFLKFGIEHLTLKAYLKTNFNSDKKNFCNETNVHILDIDML